MFLTVVGLITNGVPDGVFRMTVTVQLTVRVMLTAAGNADCGDDDANDGADGK